jgi:Ca2+-binding EF-hand superfamily protein
MRNEGGTPFEHVRNIFTKYDFSYQNGLDKSQLRIAAHKMMKLTMTEKQAEDIIKYYDRKHLGRMSYTRFVVDVCKGVKSILTFTELTPEVIEKQKKILSANPFIPRPFQAQPSKVLEQYKRSVKLALAKRITDHGGTIKQIVTTAFQDYDPRCTGKVPLDDWERLVAITKKFDVNITKEEAISLINTYDRDGDGAMVYSELIKDMTADGTHFMEDNKAMIATLSEAATSRTPADISQVIDKFRVAVDKFVMKSQGDLKARDVFHGTCLRFDPHRTGRLNKESVLSVAKALGVRLKEATELGSLVTWFDTNASDWLDYNEFTKQLYGDDISTRAIKLPHLSKHAAAIMAAKTQGAGAAASP